jgi:hypothetical protein
MIDIDLEELEKFRTKGSKNKKKKASKDRKSLKDMIDDTFSDKKPAKKKKFAWESTLDPSDVPGMRSIK